MALQWASQGSIKGPQGDTGPEGPAGPTGAAGPQGEVGPIGPDGARGERGTGFDPANSVPTVADLPTTDPAGTARVVVADGHIYGKEEDGTWSDMGQVVFEGPQGPAGEPGLTGPAGADGATGPAGPEGPTGPTGLTGPQGQTGLTGPQGNPGPQGQQGETGATGPRGADGIDGTDGARGSMWFSYSGTAPSLTGKQVGDWALDPTTGDVLQVVDI